MNSNADDGLDRWLGPLAFGVFLALALVACFPQVMFGTESFYARDYGALAYPNIHFQRECFSQGELPMWNPYSNCGQPFLAQWGTMSLYPLSLIYLLLPLPWSLGFFCLAHVWLGGFGMYLLARHWTGTNAGGAVAGTAYVFGGVMLASFAWPNYLVTLGWMPIVVLLAERAWREGGRWLVGAALAATMQMLPGAPEVTLFTWLIVGVLMVCDAVRSPGTSFTFVRRVGTVVLLTAGLMAAQLIPFFELLKLSHREAGFAAGKWQLPLWGWANFIVPLYNAFEIPSGQYFQYDQAFLSSVYLGGAAVVLALLAVFRWPDVRVWALFALAALSVVLAFGEQTPVFAAVRGVVPVVGIARYPVKFLFVLAFVVPLLAGCGMAALVKSRLRFGLGSITVLILAAMVLIGWAAHGQKFADYSAWPENFRSNASFSWTKTAPGSVLPDGILNTSMRGVLLVGALALLAASIRAKMAAGALILAALALVAVDGRFHTPRQNPTLPSALFKGSHWPEALTKPKLGDARVFISPQGEEFLTFVSSTNAQRVWEFKRRAEWSSLNLLDRVPKVNGSTTLQTREQRLVEQRIYSMTNRLPAGLLDFLGAAWITSSNAASEWSPRPAPMPLVSAGQQPAFADDNAALDAMTRGDFSPRQMVWIPTNLRSGVTATNAVGATVANLIAKPHVIEADINTPGPTLAVIAQSYHPAWRATVNGVDVPLLRANVAFQAVAVPAGQNRLQLVYSDFNFRAGASISAATLLACVVLWLRFGRLRER